MKIGNPQTSPQSAPAEQPRESPNNRTQPNRGDEGEGRRFGSALEKKASEKKQLAKQPGTELPSLASLPGAMPFQQLSTAPIETGSAQGVAGAMPPEINALAGEIAHTLEVSGPNEVRIQFDAKVLDGLSVTLSKEGGALQVSLQANSPEMARFLEVHAASLAQTLDRPERAAFITVETRPSSQDQQGNSGHGGQGRDGRDPHDEAHQGGDSQ